MIYKIKIFRNKPEFSAGNPNASFIPGAGRPMVTTGLFESIDILNLYKGKSAKIFLKKWAKKG